jgi:hypothetical protein
LLKPGLICRFMPCMDMKGSQAWAHAQVSMQGSPGQGGC